MTRSTLKERRKWSESTRVVLFLKRGRVPKEKNGPLSPSWRDIFSLTAETGVDVRGRRARVIGRRIFDKRGRRVKPSNAKDRSFLSSSCLDQKTTSSNRSGCMLLPRTLSYLFDPSTKSNTNSNDSLLSSVRPL